MRRYTIESYRREETDKAKKVLDSLCIEYNVASGIMIYQMVNFECDKKTWKQIKKELNLNVTSVYAKLKVE